MNISRYAITEAPHTRIRERGETTVKTYPGCCDGLCYLSNQTSVESDLSDGPILTPAPHLPDKGPPPLNQLNRKTISSSHFIARHATSRTLTLLHAQRCRYLREKRVQLHRYHSWVVPGVTCKERRGKGDRLFLCSFISSAARWKYIRLLCVKASGRCSNRVV